MKAGQSTGSTVAVSLRTLVGYAAGKLIPGLVVLVSVPVWIRVFGAPAYGTFSVVQAAVFVGSAIGAGWLRQATLRFAGRPGHGLRDQPALVLILASMSVVVVTLLIAGTVLRTSPQPLAAWGAVTLFALSYGTYVLTQTPLQRDGAVVRFNLAEVLRATAAVSTSLVFASLGLRGFTAIVLGGVAGNLVAVGATLRPTGRRGPRRTSWQLARSSWSFGWPLSIWLGIVAITLYADRFVLSLVLSTQQLGRYTATADLVTRGLTMVALPVVMAVHPVLMHAHNTGHASRYAKTLKVWSRLLMGILGASVLVAATIGPGLSEAFLGQRSIGRLALVVLAAGAALWQYSALAHKPLEIAHRTKLMMSFGGIALACELVVSLALVRRLGILGGVSGLLAGGVVYLTLVSHAVRRAALEPVEVAR